MGPSIIFDMILGWESAELKSFRANVHEDKKSLNKTSGEHENGSTGTDQEQYWVVSVRVRYYDALLFDEFY